MNPILLKELRQSVRNRIVQGAYLLYIVVVLLIAGIVIANEYGSGGLNSFSMIGTTLYYAVSISCAVILLFFIPLQTLARLTSERWSANPDLHFIAPLTPASFIWGKVWSGFALAGLFVSASIPFLFFAYFLGGVDIPNLIFCLFSTAGILFVLLLLSILFGIVQIAGNFIRRLLMLMFAFMLVGVFVALCAAYGTYMKPGFALSLLERDNFIVFLNVVLAVASFSALLYTGALAGFRASGSNRTRPLRVTASALWLVWPTWLFLTSKNLDEDMKVWSIIAMVVFSLLLIFTSSERTTHAQRQLQNAPLGLLRFVAWLFGNGQISGMTWSLLLFLLSMMVWYCIGDITTRGEGVWVQSNLTAYALAFMFIWRIFFRQKFSNSPLWLITLISAFIISVILQSLSATDLLGRNCVGNLFLSEYDDFNTLNVLLLNLLLLLAFIPLAVKDFLAFKKPE